MAVSVEAEREAQKVLLRLETEIGNPREQFEILHRLVELELGAGELEQARSWLGQADEVLDTGHLELRFRERQRMLVERVESAARSGSPGAFRRHEPVAPGEPGESASGHRQDPVAASEVEVRRAGELWLGASLDQIPERFAYVDDQGPSIPEHVHYIPSTVRERSAGVGRWIATIFYAALIVMFAIMGIVNIDKGNTFHASVSAGLIVFFGALCALNVYRIRTARADARAFAAGTYRLGWFFDNDVLVLRAPGGFSVFPRARVVGARVDSHYDSETKQTRRRLAVAYHDDSRQPVEFVLDDVYDVPLHELTELIDRWKIHGRI